MELRFLNQKLLPASVCKAPECEEASDSKRKFLIFGVRRHYLTKRL